MERFSTPLEAASTPAEQASRRLVLSSLWRDSDPLFRAAHAERNLVRLIDEWPAGAGIDLLLRTAGRGGRVRADLDVFGPAPSSWLADLRSAFDGIASVHRSHAPRTPLGVAQLAELVRDPARSFTPLNEEPPRPDASTTRQQHPAVALPAPSHNTSSTLLTVLRTAPSSFVRTIIAAPTILERSMLHEQLHSNWNSNVHPSLDEYQGSPVRIRTFVGASTPQAGLAPLRAALRGWGSALLCVELDPEQCVSDAAQATIGHIRPEGWALAMLRLPASGIDPEPGMPSRVRPARPLPMHPVPTRTPDSIAIGRAWTISGTRVPAWFHISDFTRHFFIDGATGTGKSNCITLLARALTEQNIGVTVMEHHGTGVDSIARALTPAAAARTTIVRHGNVDDPAGINLFAGQDPDVLEQNSNSFIELIQSIFDPKHQGIVGPRWLRWFSLLREAVSVQFGHDATLLHLLSVGSDLTRVDRLAQAISTQRPDLAHRLRAEISGLRGEEAANLTAWTMSKFQPLISQRATREIFGQPRDAVNVTEFLDSGENLLIDLAGSSLGLPTSRMLGALWLLKFQVAMGRRKNRRSPHVLIIDEAHLYTFGALSTLLAEARKYGLGIVLASQSLTNMSAELQLAIEANVANHISFRLGRDSVQAASFRHGGWPGSELATLPDLHAAASLTRAGTPQDPFLLSTPYAGADSPESQDQADAIDARSAQRWRAQAIPRVVDDLSIDRALRAAAPAPRPWNRQRPAGAPPNEHPGEQADGEPSDKPSFLDEWLARRQHASHSIPLSPEPLQTATATPSPSGSRDDE